MTETIEKTAAAEEIALTSNTETFGKFSCAQALLSAYKQLEKEFTRKCQRLAELASELKKLKESGGNSGATDASALLETGEEAALENVNAKNLGTSANGGLEGAETAVFNVSVIADSSNPAADASPENPEITGRGKEMVADGESAGVDAGGFGKCITVATAQAGGIPAETADGGGNVFDGITLEDLARNGPLVEEFVLKNDKILGEIFAAVALRQSCGAKSPRIISGSGAIVLSHPKKPKSLDEATDLAREYFK